MEPWVNLLISVAFVAGILFLLKFIRDQPATPSTSSSSAAASHGKIIVLDRDSQFDEQLSRAGSKPVGIIR